MDILPLLVKETIEKVLVLKSGMTKPGSRVSIPSTDSSHKEVGYLTLQVDP
jgi:hypothetical protein